MLAGKPGDNNTHSMIVTRRGREAVEQGIATVRSVNRLQEKRKAPRNETGINGEGVECLCGRVRRFLRERGADAEHR
jgi:hypothetical protein